MPRTCRPVTAATLRVAAAPAALVFLAVVAAYALFVLVLPMAVPGGMSARSALSLDPWHKLVWFLGVPLRQAVKSCTINPARAIGVDDVTGSIAVGKRADFTVLSPDLKELGCVYIKGKRI